MEFHGEYDFAPGSVTVMRKFRLTETGRLRSCFGLHWWEAGENVAACNKTGRREKCLDPDHECGFWAYYDGTVFKYGGNILGVIEGYGKTTIGTKGVRVEKARILAVVSPHPSRLRRWGRCLWDTHQAFYGAGLGLLLAWWFGRSAHMVDQLLSVLLGCLGTLFFVIGALLLVAVVHQARPAPPGSMEKMRQVYPDVRVFASKKEMLAAFPLSANTERKSRWWRG